MPNPQSPNAILCSSFPLIHSLNPIKGFNGEMKGTVLITGGAGFIGSHVAAELLKAGYNVRVLDSLVTQVHGETPGRPSYLRIASNRLRVPVRFV